MSTSTSTLPAFLLCKWSPRYERAVCCLHSNHINVQCSLFKPLFRPNLTKYWLCRKKYALHSWIHFSFRLKRDFNWFFFTFCCCWCCLRLAWSCVSNTSAAFSTKKLKEKIVYLEKWTWLGILTKKRRKKKTDWLTHISMYLITYNIFQLTFLCKHFLF